MPPRRGRIIQIRFSIAKPGPGSTLQHHGSPNQILNYVLCHVAKKQHRALFKQQFDTPARKEIT